MNLANAIRKAFTNKTYTDHYLILPNRYALCILTGYCSDTPSAVVELYHDGSPMHIEGYTAAHIFFDIENIIKAIEFTRHCFTPDNAENFWHDFHEAFRFAM